MTLAHGPDPGAVLSLGLVHNSSTAALLHSTEEEDSEDEEEAFPPLASTVPAPAAVDVVDVGDDEGAGGEKMLRCATRPGEMTEK